MFALSVFLCVALLSTAYAAGKMSMSEKKNKDALINKYCTNSETDYKVLAYGEQRDDIVKDVYTFLNFQEVDKTDDSAWSVRVVSNFLTASRINADTKRGLTEKAEGKEYVTFGSPFVAPKGDKRVIEYRYYPKKKMVEVYAVLRDAKRNAKKPLEIKANSTLL